MIDITTISSKGQVVIPKGLREKAGLVEHDKLLVISDKDKIVLEKISEKESNEKKLDLLTYFAEQFRERGLTKQDVEKEIVKVRNRHA